MVLQVRVLRSGCCDEEFDVFEKAVLIPRVLLKTFPKALIPIIALGFVISNGPKLKLNSWLGWTTWLKLRLRWSKPNGPQKWATCLKLVSGLSTPIHHLSSWRLAYTSYILFGNGSLGVTLLRALILKLFVNFIMRTFLKLALSMLIPLWLCGAWDTLRWIWITKLRGPMVFRLKIYLPCPTMDGWERFTAMICRFENLSQFPAAVTHWKVAFTPKGGPNDKLRPLSVGSMVYRIWARCRVKQLSPLLEQHLAPLQANRKIDPEALHLILRGESRSFIPMVWRFAALGSTCCKKLVS